MGTVGHAAPIVPQGLACWEGTGRGEGRGTHLVLVGQAAPVIPQVLARRDVRRDHTVEVAREDDTSGPRARLRFLPSTSLQTYDTNNIIVPVLRVYSHHATNISRNSRFRFHLNSV